MSYEEDVYIGSDGCGPIVSYKHDGSEIKIDFRAGRSFGTDLLVHPMMYKDLLDKMNGPGLTCEEFGCIDLGQRILSYSKEGITSK